jgi:hypothetical protein
MPGTSQWSQGFLLGSNQPRIVLQFSNVLSGSRLLPNPSFKGEAQQHGTLAIKCRALRPILHLLSSAPCRRAPP